MKKNLLKLMFLSACTLMLSACSNNAASTDTSAGESVDTSAQISTEAGDSTAKGYKIGVLQLVQHPALDKANEGFIAALDEAGIQYSADQQNAGGELSSAQLIAEKFVNDKEDLIFAIATPAAQSAAGVTEDIPIVITAVTDPKESGLVESNEKPGGNITGTSDLTPVKEQIDLLKELVPDAKKIGILYSTAEANSVIQVNLAKEAAKALGMEVVEYTVSNLSEIQSVVESMIGSIDALYIPTDNTVASGMSTVTMITNENKIPVIGAESAHVDKGALATYGIDYYELGKLTGKQAVAILKEGKNPADMPIEYLDKAKFKFSVNEETAKELGIDVSKIEKN